MVAILDLWISPNLQKSTKIERKVPVVKPIKELYYELKTFKLQEVLFFIFKRAFPFSEKNPACQKLIAIVTSKSMNTTRPH